MVGAFKSVTCFWASLVRLVQEADVTNDVTLALMAKGSCLQKKVHTSVDTVTDNTGLVVH